MSYMSDAPFTILAELSDSSLPRLISPDDLRVFCKELEERGNYQILAWKRDGDTSDQIEIYISIPKKV